MGRPASQGNAIAALIVSIVTLCLCGVFSIPALILSIVGMVQVNSNPKSSRMCTMIAWILIGVSVIAGILAFLFNFALAPSSYYYDDYYTTY